MNKRLRKLILGLIITSILLIPYNEKVFGLTTYFTIAITDDISYAKTNIKSNLGYLDIRLTYDVSGITFELRCLIVIDAKNNSYLSLYVFQRNTSSSEETFLFVLGNFTKLGETYTLYFYASTSNVMVEINGNEWTKTVSGITKYESFAIRSFDQDVDTTLKALEEAYTPQEANYIAIYYIQTNNTFLDPPRADNFTSFSLGDNWLYKEWSDRLEIYYKTAPNPWNPLIMYITAIVLFFGLAGALLKLVERVTEKGFSGW